MNTTYIRSKIQIMTCIFFSALFCATTGIITHGADYSPQQHITVSGGRTHVVEQGYDYYVTAYYELSLISYDSKTNSAHYKVTSHYDYESTGLLYSDNLYINGSFVGTFSSNNGWHNAGDVNRTESFNIYLHSGENIFKTTDVDGVGGASLEYINIRTFASPPEVHGVDGVWREGEVAKGIRTWQSLWTDGAAGSTEGNKQWTGTGFYFTDKDEDPDPVYPYKSNPISKNGNIDKITDVNGRELPRSVDTLNNPGTYIIHASTSDSSKLKGYGTRRITVKYNNPPTISAQNRTFYEGQYTASYWYDTLRWKDVSASDAEDGNLTSKVQVIYDNVNVSIPGKYTVRYQVTDSLGKTATKDVTITVLFNNPPTITGEDRWFYEDETITSAMLLERVKANDQEDGDITIKVVIKNHNIQNGVVGDYTITYKVTDSFGKSAETINTIHIVRKVTEGEDRISYLRFISKPYVDTLKANSIWRTSGYSTVLNDTLQKSDVSQAIELWELSSDDVERIRLFNQTHNFSASDNQIFYDEFADLIK